MVRAQSHQQEQTPSYLPSYTRLGHAIPGSKTVSVGVRAREQQEHQQSGTFNTYKY